MFSLAKCEAILSTEQDRALTKVIADKLNVFYKVTLLFYGSKYSTANYPNVCDMKIGING